jgi:hypothetical protein
VIRHATVAQRESVALVLPDELIDFLGERYLKLPAIWRRRMPFERYLCMRVRNGALFEKLRRRPA